MAAIHRSVAALRIMGDELDPSEITNLLGSTPTYSHSKGEVLQRPKGRIANFGMWRLDAPALEPSEFNDQVALLLAQLTQDLAIWEALSARHKVDLFCGWFMKESNEGEDISPATLVALGTRGISLGLDIYAPKDE